MIRVIVVVAIVLALVGGYADAAVGRKLDFPLRGKTLTLTVYRPAAGPKGTIIMGSGDVGWVGLGAAMADYLSDQGYIVAGVNVRQYLSMFTVGKTHLTPADPPADYRELSELLKREGLLHPPVVVSGISEGAAVAVLVASAPANHGWLQGVITMGVPPRAELAWKWTDFTTWITKGDAREPSFAPDDYVASVSPLPLVMIQSEADEYVSEVDYKRLEAAARSPKKLVLIAASNHRFTDKPKELRREYLAALAWIEEIGRGRK